MASKEAALRNPTSNPKVQPERSAPRKTRPELGVLDRRHVLERARRRQARALLTLSALCVAVPLMIAAVGNAFVASAQVQGDSLQTQISAALQTQQNLQVQRAELTAPDRILHIAEAQLHMVTPSGVTYLAPVNPGASVLDSHGPGSTALTPAATATPPVSSGSRGGTKPVVKTKTAP